MAEVWEVLVDSTHSVQVLEVQAELQRPILLPTSLLAVETQLDSSLKAALQLLKADKRVRPGKQVKLGKQAKLGKLPTPLQVSLACQVPEVSVGLEVST